MFKYIVKRLLMLIPVIIGVTFIVFFILNLSPGDPAAIILGDQATAEALEMKREELGLNDPLLVRYVDYMVGLAHGDLGLSYRNSISVWDQVIDRLPNTALLAACGILVALVIGIPIGIISARKQYSLLDNISMVGALVGVSMPNFWSGLLLVMIFLSSFGMAAIPGHGIRVRPPGPEPDSALRDAGYELGGHGGPYDPVLHAGGHPAGLHFHGTGQRRQRACRHLPAHAPQRPDSHHHRRGFAVRQPAGRRHAGRDRLLLAGLGRLMVENIKSKDIPMVMGCVVVMATMFTLVNLVVDIIYSFVDPRIKSQYKKGR